MSQCPEGVAPFDWMGLVILPIIITIVVGGVVSIYTAFLVTRIVAFRQIRLSAVQEIASLRKAILESQNYMGAYIFLRWFLETPGIAFAAEEQWEASLAVRKVRDNLRSYFRNEFESVVQNRGYESRNDLTGEAWFEVQGEIFTKATDVIKTSIRDLTSLRPNRWRILGIYPSNTTLNKMDQHPVGRRIMALAHWAVKTPERWEKFMKYCRGETDDF